jgi:hypothetical protein
MKLSQWHDGKVKPVHIGVYERKDGWFNYFDGKHWMRGSDAPHLADRSGMFCGQAHENQKIKWRGIVKDEK